MMAEEKKKILVVDDEIDLVDILTLALEASGYEVTAAHDGQEAISKVAESKPNLIILDVMMPKMDGFQVCRMLKFNDETKDIPIIMLTARAQPADSALGEEVGANQYMSKPFETKELIVNIQKLLG